MLGTAEADAFCAERNRLLGITRGVCVGADMQFACDVSPAHEAREIAGDGGFHSGDQAIVHVAGGAVDGDQVAFLVFLAIDGHGSFISVELQVAAADNSRAAHAAGHDSRVRGHTAKRGQDRLGEVHAFDIFRRGLLSD